MTEPLRDLSGRVVRPSWAFGKSAVFVDPDVRDLIHPGDERCGADMSLAEGCGLRRGHESGHAANVRVYFQSLEAYWVDDAPERHPDVTCPECGALDTKCAMCGGTGAVTHSQWVQWGEEE